MELFETKYWRVNLNRDQGNLGKCVVIAKSQPPSLAELTEVEWVDFGKVVKKLEETLSRTFRPSHFNWKCLMNDAFAGEDRKPAVHWHFMPRHAKSIQIAGETFSESEFPKTVKTEKIVSDGVLAEIAKKIKENL
jgi:diadenosine tetraphosphate (Ap4A) HIT family hydrolase